MINNKEWQMEFAGVLAENDETKYEVAFINTHDIIQFQIKVITDLPESFPRDVECVTGYATDFNYTDDISLEKPQRIEKFLNELSDYIFFFKVYISNESYFKATSISLTKKSEGFNRSVSLRQYPVYSNQNDNITQEIFESRIILNENLPNNNQISKEEDDIPLMIVWDNDETCTFYGEVNSFIPTYNSIQWEIKPLRKNTIAKSEDNSHLFDCYFHKKALYVPQNIEFELSEKLVETSQHQQTTLLNEDKNFEEIFLKSFSYYCKKNHLFYEDKDLYNFHTSIKNGNIVILAGMSGTGKSKLVQCYSEALQLSKDQLLFIPVRPYWQDDSDVIGYLDTMNNVYRPGDSGLVNLLIQAQNSPNDMFVVCFDEMNIARVEHYFSQLLSVLELDTNKRELKLYNDDYQAKIYNGNLYKPTIKIGQNILFVGTVNLDESTFHFSDKVLDRANVLNLKMVPYYDMKSTVEKYGIDGSNIKQQVSTEPIKSTHYLSFRKNESNISLSESESRILWDIHIEIHKNNKNIGVGWRIVKQISTYLSNLPEKSPLDRDEAFDLQLVQRVLTKIRGNNEGLETLIGTYDDKGNVLIESIIMKIISEYSDYTFDHTKANLINKSRELNVYGYTV
ncbi:McrB family protein [Sporosarcina sp. FA9]|uniref:McrB family protein n=1 Tax=Sporosarcina sp. FA9 TaxID=3413030 RepID=UPI003F658158